MYISSKIDTTGLNNNPINDSPFRIGSSNVDWCEPNYAVTEYISEFWNTANIINVWIKGIQYILLFGSTNNDYTFFIVFKTSYKWNYNSLAGQLVDEISILWVVMAGYTIFLPAIYFPQSLRAQRHRFIYSCIVLTIIVTCLSIIYPYANAFALMILGLPSTAFLAIHLSRCDNRRIKNLGIHCLGMWGVAVTIWICDRMFCSFWLSISFPYLHAFWHVLIIFSSNEAIVVCAYLVVKYQYPQANLILHAWPNEQWGCFSLPYLKFHDDGSYLSSTSNNFATKSIV
ncbi:unnamed protein product [Adineta steineri]|uniref:Alkaline ceramidase n=1 Tax=Adineta steineri TaxID=433720 RepID=A0A814VLH8_9BILA|nr:unnamed protein product [Adineta steineri]